MNIILSPEAEARVHELIARGGYGDPDTVVEEALRVLEARDKLVRLKALIAAGDEQAERGEVVPWTPDFVERLRRQSAENVRLGKPFKDEVIP